MSQFSHPSQKKSQLSQENLLQGLQGSKSTQVFLVGERKNEFEGSMLLDSINHLLKEVQKKYSPIKQVDETQIASCEKPKVLSNVEKDDAQTVLQYQIIAHQNHFDQPIQSKFQPSNIAQFPQLLPYEINHVDSNFINPNEIKQPLMLTNYNICNSDQKESQVKRDLNSSLFVEVSDRKDLDLSYFMPMGIDLSLEKENNKVDQPRQNQHEIIDKVEYLNEKLAQIKSKRTQLTQNYSLDSSNLIKLIPLQYFQDKIDKIDTKIKEITEKNEEHQLDLQLNKNYFNIVQKCVQIPMDIEFDSKQRQIPMDIESIGFQHNLNNIAIRNEEIMQPINKESYEQLQGEERYEQIEIINSIIERNPENDEIMKLKQFTFGKVDNPINNCDVKTSDQDFNLDASIHSQNGNNIPILDDGKSQKLIKNLSFDYSIDKQPFQNLSLNVECDNHQLEALEDLDCLLPQSIKNQSRENSKHQNNEIKNQVIKETIYIENSSSQNIQEEIIQNENQKLLKSGLKGENIPVIIQIQDQQRNFEKTIDSEEVKIGKQAFNNNSMMRMIHNENYDQNINGGLQKNSKQSNSIITKELLPPSPVFHTQHQQSRKMQINPNRLGVQNNIINYSLNPQTKSSIGQGELNHYQDRSKPQIIIHNDNYNIPPQDNQNYSNNFAYNHSTIPAPSQPHFNCFSSVPFGYFRPHISINFRNNEMFVNISGPSTQHPLKCQEALGKIEEKPDIPEDLSNKKISESIVSKVAESLITKEKDTQTNFQNKKVLNKMNNLQQSSQSQGEKDTAIQKTSISPPNSLPEEDVLLKYEFIIQLSEQYLNNTQPSEENHKQFQYHIEPYIYLRFTPQPKELIGSKLFKNGIFLIALVKLISRASTSAFLANYIIEYFQSAFGPGIDKNTYIFKCQAEALKKKYSQELEKKYLQRLRVDQSQIKKAELTNIRTQPVKRVVVHNPFLSLKSQKKDQSSQVSPRKIEKPINVSIQTEISQKQFGQAQFIQTQQAFTSNQKQKTRRNIEQISELKSQKSKEASNGKFQKCNQFTQDHQKHAKYDKNCKEGKNDKNDKNENNDKSFINEKSDKNQNKLKKSDDHRSSVGLLIKKGAQPQSSNRDQIVRFNDLYEKYRRIRENKKTDPIDNSSIKKNIVEQATKIQHLQQNQAKRSQRKQVMFSQETITKENEKGIFDDQGDGDNKKKRKMRKSKPKRDSSIEEQFEETQAVPSKTRRNFTKKER